MGSGPISATRVPWADLHHDDTNFEINYTLRHNMTSLSRCVSGTTWVTSHACYDTLGNVTQVVDGNGNPTTYDYTENWADTSCIPSGTLTAAIPTTVTDGLGHRTKSTHFTCTNLSSTVADENDLQSSRSGTEYTYDWQTDCCVSPSRMVAKRVTRML